MHQFQPDADKGVTLSWGIPFSLPEGCDRLSHKAPENPEISTGYYNDDNLASCWVFYGGYDNKCHRLEQLPDCEPHVSFFEDGGASKEDGYSARGGENHTADNGGYGAKGGDYQSANNGDYSVTGHGVSGRHGGNYKHQAHHAGDGYGEDGHGENNDGDDRDGSDQGNHDNEDNCAEDDKHNDDGKYGGDEDCDGK